MSVSVAFQDLVLAALKGNDAVAAIVGDRVIDGPRQKTDFPYVSLGSTDARRLDADCIRGRSETLQLDCWSQDQGKLWPCKELVNAVEDALHELDGEMTGGALVSLSVEFSTCFIDRDGITAHGVVQVTGMLEEAAEA